MQSLADHVGNKQLRSLHGEMMNCDQENKFSNNNNNNNLPMSCPSTSTSASQDHQESSSNEDHQKFNETDDQEIPESNDSDNSEIFFMNSNSSHEDDDIQALSSPSNSFNSDCDQQWYAYRGRWGINPLDNQIPINQMDNNLPLLPDHQQPAQEEEETDFLEMDFEPDTNSEIENEAKFSDYVLPNGCHNPSREGSASNQNSFNFLNHHLPLPLPQQQDFRNLSQAALNEPEIIRPTGTKPKQLTTGSKIQKGINQKHVTAGDNTFRITSTINHSTDSSSSLSSYNPIGMSNKKVDEVYNLGASSSRASLLLSDRPSHGSQNEYNQDLTNLLKKSPSKSSNQHYHKHQRLHEEQNDQFLFDIDPIKPRNSVTIYTTNCDEKILIDALTSLNLEPNREIISSYFNRAKPSTSTNATTCNNCELNMLDYVIYRSKLNCNYTKLIELIQRACKHEDDDSYGAKRFEVNFYPLDLFSTTPELIDLSVNEIVKRWTPQTDLTPLVNIRNKYFYQTNVLGKIVNIIRKINQKPPATFKENETIKIPQFYVSGYITITMLKPS